ncbi:MAG TPA: aminotransferase class I/II-fold pyridoxal phosphate-dependent enzyme [Actinomycetaceae bacterium]|nr:aminotransferase class I/II-fold pyridoxal phosphate-dependent enzyme [Actinomycetaceae bacterium]
MTTRIRLSPPDVGTAEEEAVLRALRSGWVAPLGPEVDAFEAEIAEFTGREHAAALSSGTAALHLGLLNMGVGPGDHVVTATMTFAATANAITYTGATPVFVDCDESGNIDPALLEHAIEDLQAKGKKVAAIVPVDLLGKIADYGAIEQIAERAGGIPVLADSAESLGAVRNGRPAGSFGDAAVLSFNGNKVMTTSGGGMLLTDDADLAERTRYLATQARQPVIHYEHVDVGYNYRLSNILAAIGRAQLGRLDGMIERRRRHRRHYRELFESVPGISVFGTPDGSDDDAAPGSETRGSETRGSESRGGRTLSGKTRGGETRDNFWLTSILVDTAEAGWTARDLIRHLDHAGIEARPLWKPMHLQPVYSQAPAYTNGTSECLFRNGVSLPSGSVLSEAAIHRITRSVRKFARAVA